MIFGPCPAAEALGAILAHTTRLPGRVIHKGTKLDEAAIAALRAAGLTEIVAARLEPSDIGEDEAAARIAHALCTASIGSLRPGTGRANLRAEAKGLFRADRHRIAALNQIHEGITIATLADMTQVAEGDMLATVKIIPFAVPRACVEAAEAIARSGPALRLPASRPLKVALIVGTDPGLKESILRGTEAVMAARIAALGGSLLPPIRVAHSTASVTAALTAAHGSGADLLLYAGASAVVDRADVGPAAIIGAGGRLDHFGMPVDPGNLVCVGRLGAIPALVLPGCARSPSLNGIDLILRLIFAGEPAGGAEITAMGVGGLLKEFPARPAPRAGKRPAPPAIAAVVLAAGLSSRMAPRNKLLVQDREGTAMVARVASACAAAGPEALIVVTGHEAGLVQAAISAACVPAAVFVQAAAFAEGLSASLRAGLQALPATATAALICLGDMPLVTPSLLRRLMQAYDPDEGRLIIVPTRQGKRGNPVLWDRRFFAEICALQGDTGARALLRTHADLVHEVDVETDAIFMDFDTPESLTAGLPLGLGEP